MVQLIPNSFGLDVYAKRVVSVNTVAQLLSTWQQAQAERLPILILGEGSNTLFTCNFLGVIILNRIQGITVTETDQDWLISVGAGEIWHNVVSYTVNRQIGGLENLALIPGCTGSAPIQNIGAYGVEFQQVADYVELLELATGKRLIITDGQYGYRDSIFKQRYLHGYAVISVGMRLSKEWLPIISYGELAQLNIATVTSKMIFDKVCEIRHSKLPDPKLIGNGGSFFKNPLIDINQAELLLKNYPALPHYPQDDGQIKLAAGWLIDQCQLKGYQIGGAAVHNQQALVLTNQGHATAQEVVELARFVRNRVAGKFAVNLSPEIRFIGSHGEINAEHLLASH